MPIKPIDYQISIPRTSEFSRIHNEQQTRDEIAQQYISKATQQKIDGNMKQVYAKEAAEKAVIREKQGYNSNDGRKKQKKREKDENDSERPKIDILI